MSIPDDAIQDSADSRIAAGATAGRDRLAAALFTAENASRHSVFSSYAGRGDALRDARKWPEGFAAYRQALDILPLHGGYLVQAGHCLKEMGLFGAAEGYYRSGLLCASPPDEVAEHLVFVAGRNRHHETLPGLRALAEAVRAGTPDAASRPTFDDLLILAETFALRTEADTGTLLAWMREGRSHAAVVASMMERWGPPARCVLAGPDAADPLRLRPAARRTPVRNAATARTAAHASPGPPPSSSPSSSASSSLLRPPRLPPLLSRLFKKAGKPVPAKAADSGAQPPTDQPDFASDVAALAETLAVGDGFPDRPVFFSEAPRRTDHRNVSRDSAAEPAVSLIILNHNKPAMTLLAVISALSAGTRVPYEIIVVDNASSPAERTVLERSDLAFRVLSLPEHRSFGEANNLGAEAARAPALLFLNNDAFPASRAIDTLLAAVSSSADAVAAGPLLLAPDGMLLEAGGIVDADGGTVRCGRFDPDFDAALLPKTNTVDYVSAACLLVRAEAFRAASGFSHRYEPAYYEDADLCLKLRQGGGRVLLASTARCFHVENATARAAGMPDPDRRAAYTGRAFRSRWGEFLSTRAPAAAAEAVAPIPAVAAAPPGPPRHVAFIAGRFASGDAERFVLGALQDAAGGEASGLAADPGWSALRLQDVAAELAMPAPSAGWVDAAALPGMALETFLSAGDGLFPSRSFQGSSQGSPQGNFQARHTVFLARAPRPAQGVTRDDRDRLAACERVLLPSAFAERVYRRLLDDAGLPAVATAVTPMASALHAAGPPVRRTPGAIVVSAGHFRDPSRDPATALLLDAFDAAGPSFKRNARLVLAGVFGVSPDGDAHGTGASDLEATAIEAAAAVRGIRIRLVVAPGTAALRRELRAAATYVEARGAGSKEAWRCDLFGYRAALAMAEGCALLAWQQGAAADLVGAGAGRTFASAAELGGMLTAQG